MKKHACSWTDKCHGELPRYLESELTALEVDSAAALDALSAQVSRASLERVRECIRGAIVEERHR